jgi:hypothetical protein
MKIVKARAATVASGLARYLDENNGYTADLLRL